MTELLYMEDCYLKEFEAEVISVNEKFIELNKTAFYPESGGQPSDFGKFISDGKEYNVIFVKKEKDKVLHEVDKEGLKSGDKIQGTVDWNRRHLFMRYHTGSHVLARVIFDELGASVTGSQITTEYCRNDFTLENFDRNLIKKLEEKANSIIKEGRAVRLELLPREEALKIPDLIRTKANLIPESVKLIRVVEIENLDKQACAGCHLKNTSEIGRIEITKMENKGKENRRIYFKVL